MSHESLQLMRKCTCKTQRYCWLHHVLPSNPPSRLFSSFKQAFEQHDIPHRGAGNFASIHVSFMLGHPHKMNNSHREPIVHFARVNRHLARALGLVCQYFDHVLLSKATPLLSLANQLTFWGPGRARHPMAVCAKLGGRTHC